MSGYETIVDVFDLLDLLDLRVCPCRFPSLTHRVLLRLDPLSVITLSDGYQVDISRFTG
jgi:hypothetical protein